MIKQIFRTDKKFWSSSQSDEVQNFFQHNSFFSQFYQHKDYQKVVAMTFYAKINKNSSIFLQNSKRPEAIILLSGDITISRKFLVQKTNKKIKKNKKIITFKQINPQEEYQYQPIKSLRQEHQIFRVESQCKIDSLEQSQAQILFIPSILYNDHMKKLDQQRVQIIYKGLKQFFNDVEKKFLMNLAKSNCYFKEFRINDYIYRAGSLPEQVYLLMEGNVKLQKPGFSAKKMFQMVILNPYSMFGFQDINLEHRQKNSISCSAYARLLIIPKKPFLKFAKQFLPHLQFHTAEDSSYTLPLLKGKNSSLSSYDQFQNRRNKIKRFHSSLKLQNDKMVQAKLIKNCHILVNLSPKDVKSSRIQGNAPTIKDYNKDQFTQKLVLFKRMRPNVRKLDLDNPMFQFIPKRSSSFRTEKQYNDE